MIYNGPSTSDLHGSWSGNRKHRFLFIRGQKVLNLSGLGAEDLDFEWSIQEILIFSAPGIDNIDLWYPGTENTDFWCSGDRKY